MIKDQDGYPVEHLEIEIDLRDRMVLHIQDSIIHNLKAIKKFLQIPGYEDICAGIYTYAVEEYGKILYLKRFSPSSPGSNTINLQYKRSFLNHHVKFPLALNDLPDACKYLGAGGLVKSGFISSGFITESLIADFEDRKAIFFADFTQDKKSIEIPPKVDRGLLEKAVDDFLQFMKN
jgi:hypothetical protein